MVIQARTRKRDGRRVYDVRLRDSHGKEYSKTFLTKREAEAFEVAERAARNRGAWVDPRLGSARFAEVAEIWLTANTTKRAGTLARDQSILEKHILPTLGSRSIGSVTRADVQQLVNAWTGSHAPSSTVRMYAVLRAVLSYAEDSEIIARSPCRRIRLPQMAPRLAEILDAEALAKLAAHMGVYGPMVYLGAFGLRWGEVAGLRVDRLDFLRHAVTIDRQVTRGLHGRMVESDPKTKAGRRPCLALPDWLMAMLAEVLASRGVTATDPDALLFVSPDGDELHYSNWRTRVWLPARTAAGLPTLNFHDLKHTAGTALLDEGVNIKTAQARLGHANPRTTLAIYAQATAKADREAADRLGERFRPRDGRGIDPKANYRQATKKIP
jgi:integrase